MQVENAQGLMQRSEGGPSAPSHCRWKLPDLPGDDIADRSKEPRDHKGESRDTEEFKGRRSPKWGAACLVGTELKREEGHFGASAYGWTRSTRRADRSSQKRRALRAQGLGQARKNAGRSW
eukprot:TRINITY_DN46626_c0_g1_i1.p4 TRINITY_DN46626_c0_g1~~TRINITY_DN46626_c0_g1_i1.p4  ORF type:complete len:121 (+),score=14.80 TRINITY_DN46626_c0_g1_i1:440-802(+)